MTTVLINTDDQSWGQDGAIFETRDEAISSMTYMARDFGLSSDAEIEAHVDSTLREIEIETATDDDLGDVESEIKLLGGSDEVRAAVRARRAELDANE